jgi:hypothetical protein
LEKGNLSEQKKIGGKKINLAKTIFSLKKFQFKNTQKKNLEKTIKQNYTGKNSANVQEGRA